MPASLARAAAATPRRCRNSASRLCTHGSGAMVLSFSSVTVVYPIWLSTIVPALVRLRAADGAAQVDDCRGGGPELRAGRNLAKVPSRAFRCGPPDGIRVLRQFLCADPQPGPLRYFPFGGRGVSAQAGRGGD